MNKELIEKITSTYKRHRDYANKLFAPRRAEIKAAKELEAAKKLEAEREAKELEAYYEKKKWWDA